MPASDSRTFGAGSLCVLQKFRLQIKGTQLQSAAGAGNQSAR